MKKNKLYLKKFHLLVKQKVMEFGIKIKNNMEERTYRTIKSVLKHHIKTGVRSLWTWKNDNFTMIYENYAGDDRIYTSNQLLKILNDE